jgi:hypothetical protein
VNSGYRPWTLDDASPTVQGNVYDDNGESIPVSLTAMEEPRIEAPYDGPVQVTDDCG